MIARLNSDKIVFNSEEINLYSEMINVIKTLKHVIKLTYTDLKDSMKFANSNGKC